MRVWPFRVQEQLCYSMASDASMRGRWVDAHDQFQNGSNKPQHINSPQSPQSPFTQISLNSLPTNISKPLPPNFPRLSSSVTLQVSGLVILARHESQPALGGFRLQTVSNSGTYPPPTKGKPLRGGLCPEGPYHLIKEYTQGSII